MCGYVCLLYVCALCMHLYIKVEHLLLNKLSSSVPCWHLWSCVTLSTLGTSHRKICRRSQAAMACPSQTHFNKWETHTAVITSSQRQKKKTHTHTYQKYTKSKVVTSNKKQIQLTKIIQPWQMGGLSDGWHKNKPIWKYEQSTSMQMSESRARVSSNMLRKICFTSLQSHWKIYLKPPCGGYGQNFCLKHQKNLITLSKEWINKSDDVMSDVHLLYWRGATEVSMLMS